MPRSNSRAKSIAVSAALASIIAALTAAFIVRRQTRQAEQEHPPTGEFLTVDGVRLHFLDSGGSKPAVVLFHGNGAMIADLKISGLVDRLKRHYRVIVFDRPGYGYSERPRDRIWMPETQADLFQQAFAQLGLKRSIVFGHSWGTLVALALALKRPASVAGLVLASGYYFPTARADVAIFAPPAIPVLGDIMRHTIAPFVGRAIAPKAIRKMFAPRLVTRRFAQRFPVKLGLRPSQIRASSEETALMIPAAADLEGEYKHLRVPVIIMAGAEDQIVDVHRQAMRLYEEIPHSELQVVPAMGHMLHHFATDQVIEAINAIARHQVRPAFALARRKARPPLLERNPA